MWHVHKTVCILDRFLSSMGSSPSLSVSHTYTHTHTLSTHSINLSLMWSNTQGGEFWARDMCGVFIWFLEERALFGKACQWRASGVWEPLSDLTMLMWPCHCLLSCPPFRGLAHVPWTLGASWSKVLPPPNCRGNDALLPSTYLSCMCGWH